MVLQLGSSVNILCQENVGCLNFIVGLPRTRNAIKFQYTMSSARSHSTITVPTEIQRAAADIFVLDNMLSFNKYTDEIAKKKQLTF